ncbi:MAG: DegT/DnrJ/EryC1/StrS family aminotransferase [Thermodesulfovibrionales bacterium]
MSGVKVPFLDLASCHLPLEGELTEVFRSALRSSGFIGGQAVEGFEEAFGRYCSARHCVGVGSGTDALRFALIAAGVKAGDVVVTVPNSFIATTEAITQAGAVPEFVDIEARACNMDPEKLREYLETRCETDKTGTTVSRALGKPVRAVVPVHLYGHPADMDPIMELASRHNLIVIEDACQAHGAEYFSAREGRWRRAGSMGRASAFSFYPGKNLGACGEGGAATTDDEAIARKVRMLRDHGQARKYFHDMEGYNGRLDAIQAGILSVKLGHLDLWNESRRKIAGRYGALLGGVPGIEVPAAEEWARPVFHLYVVRAERRDELQRHLAERGIATGLHYPVPLHLQNAYRDRGFKEGDFPVSEAAARRILSLPMYPALSEEQVAAVAEAIGEFARSG